MELDYYNIKHRLYFTEDHLICDTIDMYYKKSPLQGKAFYLKIMSESPTHFMINLMPSRHEIINNYCLKKIASTDTTKKAKEDAKITYVLAGAFCMVINKSGIKKQEFTTGEKYCRDICKEYKLEYSDKVRQAFSQNKNFKKGSSTPHRKLIKELLLPSISTNQSEIILKFLNQE